ncbi:MAG: chemotaxis protein CheD [Myxococcota bacterium]
MSNAAPDLSSGPITVGIAEMAVTSDPGGSIITHALGSCIAVVLWDPTLRVAGLLHYMLPSSKGARPGERPDEAFADTGVPKLFEAMYRLGSKKENLEVSVIGGASMGPRPVTDVFDIGTRNVTALKKLFLRNGVMVKHEEVGGSISRTVQIQAGTGRVLVRTPGKEWTLGAGQEAPPPRIVPAGEPNPRQLLVQSGELRVSDAPDTTLISATLGSSVCVALWDKNLRTGGLLIYQLPSAKPPRATERPDTSFGDLGVPLLFEAMYQKGSRKEDILVSVAGGARMTTKPGDDVFDVGARNITVLRKILMKNGVLIRAEDLGGQNSRTVLLEVGTGRIVVRSLGGERVL